MPPLAATLLALASLPGVEAAGAAAREACTELRWHPALRRRIPEAAAESRVRGARASAALDGAEVDVAVVRDLMRGAVEWPAQPGPLEDVLRGAVQATAESEHLRALLTTAPRQALARTHVAAASRLVDPAQLGRPRVAGEASREFTDLGPSPDATVVAARLSGLVSLILGCGEAPGLVVAALVHAEIATVRPFVRGNGLVARAMERLVIQASGLDPTGVVVPEAGHGAAGGPAYLGALAAYGSGTQEGLALWLVHCGEAVVAGAAEGTRIADAVLAGHLG